MFEITKCSSYTVFELTGSFYKEVLRQNPRETQKQFENGVLRVIQYSSQAAAAVVSFISSYENIYNAYK